MKNFILCLFLLSSFGLSAQNTYNSYLKDAVTSREHALDITKMVVEVSFEPEKGLVKGKVSHQFTVLQQKVDSVFFDAPAINIQMASLNNKPTKFTLVKTGVWVIPDKPLSWDQKGEITFMYEATPRKGIYFIGWNLPEPTVKDPFAVRKQIWTQGQGVDNRYWIPMYDDMNDKFITETVTTFDKNYQVLSNGKLISKKENKNGTLTWHYALSKPHAGYLLMLGIGKYAVATSKSKSGVPLNYYYYPEFADRMEPTYRYTPMMIDFLEEQTGIPYPWESYSQIMVQDFLYGAMENTSATVFGDFFNVDPRAFLDRNYIGVNCHEMTHQWFGDYITARDGRDAWMQESFATFYPKQLSRVLDGEEEWDWQRRQHQNSAVEAGKKDNFAVRHTSGGTARVYPKGASVISMLEYVLGPEQWKRALNHYLKNHAYANVECNDLQQAIKDKLGLNLDWFFDEWILRGGEPHYRVHYENLIYENGSNGTEIAVEQIQKTDETVHYFKMPVVLEVHYTDGTMDAVNETMDKAFEVVKINNPKKKKIAFVLFDPNSNIVKQVSFKKSFEELQEQIEIAPHYIDRYDAAVALREVELDQKREVLIEALKREKHYGIINELISQLAEDKNASSINYLQGLSKYPKAAMRDHLFKSVSITDTWKPFFEAALTDSSYDVVKTALEKLSNQYPDQTEKYLAATKDVFGMNHAVKMKWLEISYLRNGKKLEDMEKLVFYASPNYEFRTRVLAFGVLKTTNYLNQNLCGHLLQAMLSSNGRLSGPAGELVNFYALQADYKALFKQFFQKQNYSAPEKESLLKLLPWLKS